MQKNVADVLPTAEALTDSFLLNFPKKAAHRLGALSTDAAVEMLAHQPSHVVATLFKHFPPGAGDQYLARMNDQAVSRLLEILPPHEAVNLLFRQEDEKRDALLSQLAQHAPRIAAELKELMSYPDDSVGRIMDPRVQAVTEEVTIAEAIKQLRGRNLRTLDSLFLVDSEMRVVADVDIARLVLVSKTQPVSSIARPVQQVFTALDQKEDALENFNALSGRAIPVVDAHNHLIGVISATNVYQQSRDELAADVQTMVGASKDERALSSSWFAVKKRLPWLQINLLTAFLASAVVGAFEGLIAQFTALAILLPVAAGQSGNAGAQSLAVTMRGLTLKEITTRHWLRVLIKESSAGLINGVGVAVTCSLAVYFWSRSLGLALVMALAMIVSLVIACSAGALVPIVLKKFGMDPAQSSSIVLTTVTDIAGFLSFLGIATALSGTLT